jgi:hypothetical protein
MWFDIQGIALKVQGFKRIFKVKLEKPFKGFSRIGLMKRPTDSEFGSLFPWNYRMVQVLE